MHQVKMIKIRLQVVTKDLMERLLVKVNLTVSNKDKVENPQTNAGTPAYIYAIPVASLALLIAITLFVRKKI